jgi:Transposase DDE domain
MTSKVKKSMLKSKDVEGYVKFNYFHQEQKRKIKNNPFLTQNLFYNKEQDFYVCPMGQRMENIGYGKRISTNGYESHVFYYQAKRCEGCPFRSKCHQAKTDRRIEVNHRLNELKQEARERLMSEKGLEHRSKRPIEVEAVFGQLKSNNKFNRFTFTGIEKVEMEFILMAIGHNFRKISSKMSDLIKNYKQKTDKDVQNTILQLLSVNLYLNFKKNYNNYQKINFTA